MLLKITISVLILFNGCSPTEIVRPEQLENDQWKNLLILTHDGRTIRMSAGDYSIIHSGDSTILRGRGREFLNEQSIETKPFVGDLRFDDIAAVETTERSFLFRTVPIMLGILVTFYLFFFVFRNPAAS